MKGKHYTEYWHSALLHYDPVILFRNGDPILFSGPGDHEMVYVRTIGILLPPGKVTMKIERVPEGSFQQIFVFNQWYIYSLFPGAQFLPWLKLDESMLKLQGADSQDNHIE